MSEESKRRDAPRELPWIEWNGGANPVSEDARVWLRYRDGSEHAGVPARCVVWLHDGMFDDIVAYRLASSPSEITADPVVAQLLAGAREDMAVAGVPPASPAATPITLCEGKQCDVAAALVRENAELRTDNEWLMSQIRAQKAALSAIAAIPKAVREWQEAVRLHIAAVETYNKRVEYARAHELGTVSCDTEYQEMCRTQKVASSLLKPMYEALDSQGTAAPVEVGATDYKALYLELIYQVGMKHPGETRHQTALRYLKRAEEPSSIAACSSNMKSRSKP